MESNLTDIFAVVIIVGWHVFLVYKILKDDANHQ
jgi:hypothetical protein